MKRMSLLAHAPEPQCHPPTPPAAPAARRCNPFDLTISNASLQRGFNRIYDWNLAAALRRIFARHADLWRNAQPPLRPDLVPSASTIRAFDEAVTIHSFGEGPGGAARGRRQERAGGGGARPAS